MSSGHCVTVAAGAELRIGCDPSCDVVVSLPRQSASCLSPVPSLCSFIARVSCDATRTLTLVVDTNNIYAFVDGVQLTAIDRPVVIRSGAAVAFGFYSRRRTYTFVASGLCLGPLRANGLTDGPAWHQALALPLSAHVQCEARSPRSPRVVQIVAPPSPAESVASVTSGFVSMSSKRARGALSQRRTMTKGSVTHLEDAPTHTATQISASGALMPPYAISPFLVHLAGSRSVAQPLVAMRETMNGSVASAVGSCVTTGGSGFFGSCVTGNGRRMMRRQMREANCNVSLKITASSMIEELNEAFDVDSGQFYSFPPETRERLLCSFWQLADHAEMLLLDTPLTVYCQSPIICCGDLHGSFADLKIIFDKAVPFGHWSLLSIPLLFLGDYVDRGPHDVEVMLYLISWFVLCPDKIVLLRGNHEDEEVNGDMLQYREGSFRVKCRVFFGEEDGDKFWRRVNELFVRLSVIAIVDEKIFACHGGIPLLRRGFENYFSGMHKTQTGVEDSVDFPNVLGEGEGEEAEGDDTPSEELLCCVMGGNGTDVSRFYFRGMMPDTGDSPTAARERRLIRELLWNDPAAADQEDAVSATETAPEAGGEKFNEFGFRTNLGRGDGDDVIREFSADALENFLQRWGFALLIRAHQQKSSGAEMVQAGRVLTLFSCCNYSGDTNRAGACVVMDGMIHLISWQRPPAEDPIPSGSAVQPWAPGRFPMKSSTEVPLGGVQDSAWSSMSSESVCDSASELRGNEEMKTIEYG